MHHEGAEDTEPKASGTVRCGASGSPRAFWKQDLSASNLLPWLLGLLLILLVVLAYANTLHGPFTYDDYNDVLENTSIRHLWPLWEVFRVPGQGFMTRPVANLTFALDYALGGPKPFWFHLTNLLVHLGAALALLGLVRRTLVCPVFQGRFAGTAPTLALVIAGVWGLHPLATEAVAYITQRYESLASLFMLLTLYALVRSVDSPHRHLWEGLTALACLGALGSKEIAVSLPLLALLYDRTFLAGTFRGAWRARRPLYLALLLDWALFAYVQTHPIPRPFAGFGLATPWWRYALNQPAIILHYLRLTIWPHPLVFDYFWRVVTAWRPLLPGWAAVGGLLGFTGWALVRRPRLAFLPACFFAILGPTSSFMPILDLADEYRMYLPLATVIAALVVGLHALWLHFQAGSPRQQRVFRILVTTSLIGITTAFGVMTYLRNEDYLDPMDLWGSVAAAAPDNPRGHNNYAFHLALAGYLPQALKEYTKAIALAPGMAMFHSNYGLALTRAGQYEKGLKQLRMAVELDPTTSKYVDNLGFTLLLKGSIASAATCFETARQMNPKDDLALAGLASVLQAKHENPQALDDLQQAIALNPYYPGYRWQKSQILLDLGRTAEAIAAFWDTVRLEPNAQKVSEYAWTMHLQGQDAVAVQALRQTLATKPGDDRTEIRLAWILATCPDAALRNGPEAVRLATDVLQTQRPLRSPELLDLLAVAQAAAGQYSIAQGTVQEAITKAAGRPPAYRDLLQAQLTAFQQGQPWRDRPATSNLASKKPNGA
jgi:tetratricopeptide (TPR) repeat protein